MSKGFEPRGGERQRNGETRLGRVESEIERKHDPNVQMKYLKPTNNFGGEQKDIGVEKVQK